MKKEVMMIAIVGLGNPGKNYETTIHNLGYLAIDHFAKTYGLNFSKSKYMGKVAEGVIDGQKVVLLKPETFMNLSGKSVEACINMLKLNPSQILVVVDDIDLDFGELRVRAKGSAGTHNGLRDIVQRIGQDFNRLRIGAGRPDGMDLASYVLGNMSKEKLEILSSVFEKTDRIIKYFVDNQKVEGIDVNKI